MDIGKFVYKGKIHFESDLIRREIALSFSITVEFILILLV